jgi:hypothetical protein
VPSEEYLRMRPLHNAASRERTAFVIGQYLRTAVLGIRSGFLFLEKLDQNPEGVARVDESLAHVKAFENLPVVVA